MLKTKIENVKTYLQERVTKISNEIKEICRECPYREVMCSTNCPMGTIWNTIENEIWNRSREILKLGWKTRGYQLGSGIHTGWNMVSHWIKQYEEKYGIPSIANSKDWRGTDYVCCECDTPIKSFFVPAPVSVVIFLCENGHKFCYENTD